MMPRASSKKRKRSGSAAAVAAASDLYDLATTKANDKELDKIDRFFYAYASESLGMIDPDGIEKLCSDIMVDHTDVRILMLAWKMQSEKQGYFTLEEWRRCFKPLHVNTVAKLKKSLPLIEKEVFLFEIHEFIWYYTYVADGDCELQSTSLLLKGMSDFLAVLSKARRPSNFVNFYSYAFQYCLTEEKQKGVDIATVCQLLDLVLGSLFRAQIDCLIDFLKEQTDYKVINMDQWMGFYRFCTEICFPDLSNYDPDHAWPLILDSFAAWMKAKQN